MKKLFRILLWSMVSLAVLTGILLGGFIYKIKNGFPVSYETGAPSFTFPEGKHAVLLFSKTTGFRHGESIDAGKKVFGELAKKNNWFLYSTEEGGVFNPDQLPKFDVVIFNNSTGRVLNEVQQKVLEDYVMNGGSLIGIHGAGDDSHHWDWYENNLVGTKFSHHPIDPQIQETYVYRDSDSDSILSKGLPSQWKHSDEWYVFFDNPRNNGFHVLYHINGNQIISNGNLLWINDKDFGMGKDHPVAWYKKTGRGRTFYTSMGHTSLAWNQEPFVRMLENAVWGK